MSDGEVLRNMEENKLFDIILQIREDIIALKTEVKNFTSQNEKIDKAYNMSESNCKRLDKLEDNIKWTVRTSAAAIICAVVDIAIRLKF